MRTMFAGLIGILLPLPIVAAQDTTKVAPGTPVTITVSPSSPTPPPISFNLGTRHGHTTPSRQGFTHTGGGYIDVQQPTPDAIVITMTGICVAGAHPTKDSVASMNFELNQNLEVSFDDPKVKKGKVTIEGRVIGLLRSDAAKNEKRGCSKAEVCSAHVAIVNEGGGAQVLDLAQVPHGVACGENLSINDHEGTVEAPIVAGKYLLHQTFSITACHPRGLIPCKPSSAEFAPDPALDPLWISYFEPFHGVAKKDFGYQVTIKLVEDKGTPEEKK